MDSYLFLKEWSFEYPLDYWWRKKYKVPFNSSTHRNISYQDMFFDFIESSFFKKIGDLYKETPEEEEVYTPGERNFLKVQVLSEEEIDDLFDQIDLDNF